MKFKDILTLILEHTGSDILKVAIKKDGKVYPSNSIWETHYDIYDRFNIKSKDDYEFGFITPSGVYLNRTQAFDWVKNYTPVIFNNYVKVISKSKPSQPEYGYENQLESIGYRKALGIEKYK